MNKDSCVNPTIQECLELVDGCGDLSLDHYPNLVSLPEGLKISGDVYVYNCDEFKTMPTGVTESGDVRVWDCKNFTTMSKGVTVSGNVKVWKCVNFKPVRAKESSQPQYGPHGYGVEDASPPPPMYTHIVPLDSDHVIGSLGWFVDALEQNPDDKVAYVHDVYRDTYNKALGYLMAKKDLS